MLSHRPHCMAPDKRPADDPKFSHNTNKRTRAGLSTCRLQSWRNTKARGPEGIARV